MAFIHQKILSQRIIYSSVFYPPLSPRPTICPLNSETITFFMNQMDKAMQFMTSSIQKQMKGETQKWIHPTSNSSQWDG